MQQDPGATYYFALLRTIVDDLTGAGRKSFAAGLKPRLQAMSSGEFAEARLGFPTFKAFLEAAEREGVVKLERTPSDLLVLPRDVPGSEGEAASASTPEVGPGKRIRPDLWRAWIEWSQSVQRYYDRLTDKVVLLVDNSGAVQSEDLQKLRAQISEEPERFVSIPPLGAQATVDAMRRFAEAWPDPIDRDAMQRALMYPEAERAAAEFTRLLRFRSPVAGAWHLTRMRMVADAINEWAGRNNVSVDYLIDVSRSRKEASPQPGRAQFNEEELRARLVHAVQHMPIADLLRLPVPAEFLLDL